MRITTRLNFIIFPAALLRFLVYIKLIISSLRVKFQLTLIHKINTKSPPSFTCKIPQPLIIALVLPPREITERFIKADCEHYRMYVKSLFIIRTG